jgi:hypothetical protein
MLLNSLLATLIIAQMGMIFDHQGKPFAKRQQETAEPKIIVDTVTITAGWGNLELNSNFTKGQHNVAPSSGDNLYAVVTPVLTDSTENVYYYGYSYVESEHRLIVKSSGGTADTGKVIIQIFLK